MQSAHTPQVRVDTGLNLICEQKKRTHACVSGGSPLTLTCRPLPESETKTPYKIHENDSNRITIDAASTGRTPTKKNLKGGDEDPNSFTADRVFDVQAKQEEVFGCLLNDSVDSVLKGVIDRTIPEALAAGCMCSLFVKLCSSDIACVSVRMKR